MTSQKPDMEEVIRKALKEVAEWPEDLRRNAESIFATPRAPTISAPEAGEGMPPAWVKNEHAKGAWFIDGDEFVIAVPLKGGRWDIDRVVIDADGENFCLRHAESRDSYDSWEWWDVAFYMKIKAIGPMTEEEAEAHLG